MRIPTVLLRGTALLPMGLVSLVLVAVPLAVLPPLVALPVLLAGVLAVVMIGTGVGHRQAAAVLTRSRPLTPGEAAVFAPVVERLSGSGVAVPGLLVRRSGRLRPAAVAVGGHVVVSRWLLDAVYDGRLPVEEAVALVAHAIGRGQLADQRREIVWQVLTSPCQAACTVAAAIGRFFAWFPLAKVAWRLRFVVGIACVIQPLVEPGPAWQLAVGVAASGLIALTYLVPAALDELEERAIALGDAFVVHAGLGRALWPLLMRNRVPRERMQRLAGLITAHEASGAAREPGPEDLQDKEPRRRHLRLVRS